MDAMKVLVWSVLDRMVRVKCANLKRSNRLKPINGYELSSARKRIDGHELSSADFGIPRRQTCSRMIS